MLLSNKPPFLFIHIPKTAGTSIEEALFDYQDFIYMNEPHPIVAQYKTFLSSEMYDSLYKFTFVRNPWSLQLSTYKYYCESNNIDMTFNEYIKWKFTGHPLDMLDRVSDDGDENKKDKLSVAYHMNRMPQTYFLIDELGELQMDYIGSFEDIQNDFNTVVDKLSLSDVYLPHTNKSTYTESKTFIDYYDDESIEIVRKRFHLDIKIFGYEYNGNKPTNTGFVTKRTLKEYGVVIPENFFFNLGMLPYGYHDVVHRYDDNEVLRLKDEASRNKIHRRMESINLNLNEIEGQIDEKECILFGGVPTIEITVLQEEILKLREFQLVYRTQLSQIENELNL